MPLARTATQSFDESLLDVIDHLEAHGLREVDDVEFAVEEVPDLPGPSGQPGAGSFDSGLFGSEVLEDGGVPLARTEPAGPGSRRPTVVLFRRPITARAADDEDLADLLHEVIVDRVAHLLGRDPDELDPHA